VARREREGGCGRSRRLSTPKQPGKQARRLSTQYKILYSYLITYKVI